MSDVVIRVEHLSKQYRLGQQEAYKSLREVISNAAQTPLNWLKRSPETQKSDKEGYLWALDDISFEVKYGEAIGIIGRNGAGKSTLLKILSRITKPTRGRAEIYGRVGSLLEVGTGFHPELTGRENIYLNGAILGMRRAEIARKFDEIVDFAEIEQFLDTPVKRYSSGMYVRLAFAVAAHLEPEILLVDEVLAVGDAQFQKKCLGKMEKVTLEGRTILFVSHNMNAITTICQSGIILEKGQILKKGSSTEAVSLYLQGSTICGELTREPKSGQELSIRRIGLYNNGEICTIFRNSETMVLQIDCEVIRQIKGAQVAFELFNESDECLFSSTNQDINGEKTTLNPGYYSYRVLLPLLNLRSGRYSIKLSSSVPGTRILDEVNENLGFELLDDSSPILKLGQNRRGIILSIIPWHTTYNRTGFNNHVV